jgi:hypothetical protein
VWQVYEMWCSQGGNYEEYYLLGCDFYHAAHTQCHIPEVSTLHGVISFAICIVK